MEKIKEFVKQHAKKFIGGAILTAITFGIYAIYKIITGKKEES